MNQKNMLLVLPVPYLIRDGQVFLECQACNGLERWADSFDSVTLAAPTLPSSLVERHSSFTWRDSGNLSDPNRFEFVPLPWGYSALSFIFFYRSVRSTLAMLISRHHYLQFAIGGVFGDWAALAALEAHRQSRRYAIHADIVAHKAMLEVAKGSGLISQIKAVVMSHMVFQYHRRIIGNSSLGLWHGSDCYAEYSRFCKNSHLIHNIHIKPSDRIDRESLAKKVQRVKVEPYLRICYAGRMSPEKAPLEWLRSISGAIDKGAKIHATWMGDGSMWGAVQATIINLNISDYVTLTGFESNRDRLIECIKESHIMLFTHLTPESPRCLIESLACGTPIVGYHSRYASDIVQQFGGGLFAPLRDWEGLSKIILDLSKNRNLLSRLVFEASQSGAKFDDKTVFKERSKLIKEYL